MADSGQTGARRAVPHGPRGRQAVGRDRAPIPVGQRPGHPRHDRRRPAALDRASARREKDHRPGRYPARRPVRAGPADGPAVRRRQRRGAGPGTDRRRHRPGRAHARARGPFRTGELEITCTRNGASSGPWPPTPRAMGKRAWMIVLDEVANWPETRKARRFWGVLTSGNRKIADCRTVVITNAGDPQHWAWKRRETARTSPHWRFVSIPGPAALADRRRPGDPAGERRDGLRVRAAAPEPVDDQRGPARHPGGPRRVHDAARRAAAAARSDLRGQPGHRHRQRPDRPRGHARRGDPGRPPGRARPDRPVAGHQGRARRPRRGQRHADRAGRPSTAPTRSSTRTRPS